MCEFNKRIEGMKTKSLILKKKCFLKYLFVESNEILKTVIDVEILLQFW